MKKATLLLAACLAAGVSPASAAGYYNLGWDDCAALGASTSNKNFACNTNSGSNPMYVSYCPPVAMPQLTQVSGVLTVFSADASLPSWWSVQGTGSCRTGMSGNTVFMAGPFTCVDYWEGQASAGWDYTIGFYGPSTARLRFAAAVPGSVAGPVDPSSEYYAMAFALNHTKTVGFSCPGCASAACIEITTLTLYQPAGVGDYTLVPGPQSWITWQGGGGTPCTGATSARSRSWGQIKSLYR